MSFPSRPRIRELVEGSSRTRRVSSTTAAIGLGVAVGLGVLVGRGTRVCVGGASLGVGSGVGEGVGVTWQLAVNAIKTTKNNTGSR